MGRDGGETGREGGHEKGHQALEGGRHTAQSIAGHLTPARVSPLPPPTTQPALSNGSVGAGEQQLAAANANMAFSTKHQEGNTTCDSSPGAKGRKRL